MIRAGSIGRHKSLLALELAEIASGMIAQHEHTLDALATAGACFAAAYRAGTPSIAPGAHPIIRDLLGADPQSECFVASVNLARSALEFLKAARAYKSATISSSE